MSADSQFSSTCRIIFGRELGQTNDYADYLNKMIEQPIHTKSSISGKNIVLSRKCYQPNSKFIALDELSKMPAPKIDINEIKDIDSLLNAVQENIYYCGNSNIGISTQVSNSDACNDASFVSASSQVIRSKNVSYSYGVRECENVYGCMLVGEVKFSIRSQITFKSVRCFESYLCVNSSDTYCCFNCRNCSDAIFSFNQTSKRNVIGNLELEKQQYLKIKTKLIGEIAEDLSKKKTYPSLFEFIGEK